MQVTASLVKKRLEDQGYFVIVHTTSRGTILSFDYKGSRRFIASSCPDLTSAPAVLLCADKTASSGIAKSLQIPTPPALVYENYDSAIQFLEQNKTIVVKPAMGSHGYGVTVNISSDFEMLKAIDRSKAAYSSQNVLLQSHVEGEDYRILVIGGKMRAASLRVPASVTGDGKSSIKQLIRLENVSGDRTRQYSSKLCLINESLAKTYLGTLISKVPAEGESIRVVGTSNIGTGGHAEDRTSMVPKYLQVWAEAFAASLNAFVCGVDFMYDTNSKQWYFLEANTSPSFGLHVYPKVGQSQPVDEIFVSELLKAY